MAVIDEALSAEAYCYLTTVGRVSGRPHTIEIWFGLKGDRLHMLAGGREKADWVRNLGREPGVTVRIGEMTFRGRARVVVAGTGEDALARRLLLEKYTPGYTRGDLGKWGREALPVAVDIMDTSRL